MGSREMAWKAFSRGTLDQDIPRLAASVSGRSGVLEPELGDHVKQLMQTFVARSPSLIADLEIDMAGWASEHATMIQGLLDRALTPEIRTEVSQYLDPRMPAVAARMGLAALAGRRRALMRGWYDGLVQIVQAASVMPMLTTLGIDHFPTFDEPVVQWELNAGGLVASFSVSPNVLAVVVNQATQEVWPLALRHVVAALHHREFAICRSEAAPGPWLNAAQSLVPWSRAASARLARQKAPGST